MRDLGGVVLRPREMGQCLEGHHPVLLLVGSPTVRALTKPLRSVPLAFAHLPLGQLIVSHNLGYWTRGV